MKLKEGFLLREIAGQTVVLPSGDVLDLNMMITLNETGRFLWERLEKGSNEQELVDAILEEYEIDEAGAKKHVAEFVKKLNEFGFLA
jgi:hypothetical protein